MPNAALRPVLLLESFRQLRPIVSEVRPRESGREICRRGIVQLVEELSWEIDCKDKDNVRVRPVELGLKATGK